FSCGELDEESVDPELDFQPLAIGNYWEYRVVETKYFGESDSETQDFFFRDIVTSQYLNETGEEVFLIQRHRSTDLENWQPEKAFSYRVSKGTLIRNLDNLSTVCLVFPPLGGKIWDGNVYNALPENPFSLDFSENYQLGNRTYEDAAIVTQSEEDDLITLRDRR